MKPPTKHDVDSLGQIKAAIAELIEREDELKRRLTDYHAATGVTEFHGELYDATVSTFSKLVLDLLAVKAKLTPQFLRAHTTKVPIVRVTVTARKRT